MRRIIIYTIILLAGAMFFLLSPRAETVKVYFHQTDRVAELDFEKYITGVVAAEMPASFETEALKAQAVAARTYAKRKIASGNADPYHKGADICTDSTHCQAYRHLTELESQYRRKIHKSVMATEGQVAVYNGQLISALFHSSAHGFTERSVDVWGGDVPYLQSVASPWDSASPDYITEVKLTALELRQILKLPHTEPLIGEITRSGAGGVMEIKLSGQAFKGTDIRSRLKLRSTCFTVTESGGVVAFRVTGYGHGVGLSQWGAQGMAKEGYTYSDILTHYYTGIEILHMS